MDKGIKIYFNKEADYIKILFEIKEGIFQETEKGFCNEKDRYKWKSDSLFRIVTS